jgi:NACalpha-BTF3-like transcription factor
MEIINFYEKRKRKNKKEKMEICSICHELLTNNKCGNIECSHRYHTKCIKVWLNKNNNCPICRTKIVNIEYNISTHSQTEVNEADIDIVTYQTGCTREQAITSLIINNYDIVDAIMKITM